MLIYQMHNEKKGEALGIRKNVTDHNELERFCKAGTGSSALAISAAGIQESPLHCAAVAMLFPHLQEHY